MPRYAIRKIGSSKIGVRVRLCSGINAHGGKCGIQALPEPDKDGLYRCHFHTTDSKRRAIARFNPKNSNYIANGPPNKRGNKAKRTFKWQAKTTTTETPNVAVDFATALQNLVKTAVNTALVERLAKLTE